MTTLRDEPALEDETTAKLFELIVQRRWTGTWGLLAVPLATVLCVKFLLDAPDVGVFLVGAALAFAWVAYTDSMSGGSGWAGPVRRLLSEQPWRPSAATVLDVRGTVLALEDGTHVRVHGLPAVGREVVVRAKKVELVGPDSAGWLAVRVDGTHTPFPARVVRSREAEPAKPSTTPVTTMWVEYLVAYWTRFLVALAVWTVVLVVLALVVTHAWWVVPGLLMFTAIGAAKFWSKLGAAKKLRHRPLWQKAFAIIQDWESRQNGVGAGRIELRFPDGRRCVAELTCAPLDVLANAWREEALWVTDGNVVGFPDYPAVAIARFVEPDDVSGP